MGVEFSCPTLMTLMGLLWFGPMRMSAAAARSVRLRRARGCRGGRCCSPMPMIGRSRRPQTQFDRGSWSASLSGSLSSLLDCFTDAHIGPATADVAGHRVVDLRIRRMRFACEQCRSGHDLARLAVAALDDLA